MLDGWLFVAGFAFVFFSVATVLAEIGDEPHWLASAVVHLGLCASLVVLIFRVFYLSDTGVITW